MALGSNPAQQRATHIARVLRRRKRSFPKLLKIQTARSIFHASAGNAAEPNRRGLNEMGLYSNIAKKRARIKAGSGEKMRKPGAKGAPTASAFKKAAKTAKGKKK